MWWDKYIDKIPSAGISYPENNWVVIKSKRDNSLATFRFHHESPKAVVIILHGLNQCAEVMAYVAKALYGSGNAVLAFDQEGHGRSEGERGLIPSIADYIDSAEEYLDIALKEYPARPIFLLGESMGGMVSIGLCLRRPANIRGLVLFAPGLQFSGGCNSIKHCLISCCRCMCPNYVASFDGDRSTCSNNSMYSEWALAHPAIYSGGIAIRTIYSISQGMNYIRKRAKNITNSMILFQGGDDIIINATENQKMIEKAIARDKAIVYVPEMRHAISSEPNIDEIINQTIFWISKRSN